ncbi:Ubiquitin-like protein [Gracilaria domingensis]|nr:Ubiquitin-like protein [Gracilaria domingensis]
MQSDRSDPSPSNTPPPSPQPASPPSPPPVIPLLPAPAPATSAPVPPPLPAPPTPVAPVQQPSEPVLHSFIGTLDALQRAAQRQNKWVLIIILPSLTPSSAPSSFPATRTAWGPNASHRPSVLHTTTDINDKFILWRRTTGSSDAERYTAFFPVDGLPHVALLDPRSGERLCVWGNVDGANMDQNRISEHLWSTVQESLHKFLEQHSLEDGALGPLHTQDKPWAVRTRRMSHAVESFPSTSVMDDEEAAIAAAIKASLEDVAAGNSVFDNDHVSDMDRSDDTDSTDATPTLDDYGPSSSSNDGEGDQSSDVDIELTSHPQPVLPQPSRPILIPERRRDAAVPSSVESLSSSYMDRMQSSFRSSANPQLVQFRRLREEQDAELARSLQEDRARERKELAEAEHKAAVKEHMLNAAARLPDEPTENSNCLTIAIRIGGGKRITRRFNRSDLLQSVADFVIASSGIISLAKAEPCLALKTAGPPLKRVSWQTRLSDLGLSNRTMFTLNEAVL